MCNKCLLSAAPDTGSALRAVQQWESSSTGCLFVTWLPLHTAIPLDIDETELLFVPSQRRKCSFKSVNDPWHS